MAGSIVTPAEFASAGSATAVSKASAAAMPAGTAITVYAWKYGVSAALTDTCTVTDNLGNTYVQQGTYADGPSGASYPRLAVFVALNCAAGTPNITATWTGANKPVTLAFYKQTGLSGGGAVDQVLVGVLNAAVANDMSIGTTPTLAQSSGETATACFVGAPNVFGAAIHTGWTLGVTPNSYNYEGLMHQVTSASTGVNPGFSTSGTFNFAGACVVLKDAPSAATGATATGPSSGTVGAPSTSFTVTLAPTGGTSAGVVYTPNDGGQGGTFTPTSVTLSTGTPSGTFTYTAASAGAKTISFTNNGGLSNPASLPYTASVGGSGSTSLSITLTSDGTTPRANLTGLKWALFDTPNPAGFAAPSAKGSGATTNASGVLTLNITGTALTSGQTGWLVVSDSDGTTTQSPPAKAFSGPVQVT